jgi:hypothetical protein
MISAGPGVSAAPPTQIIIGYGGENRTTSCSWDPKAVADLRRGIDVLPAVGDVPHRSHHNVLNLVGSCLNLGVDDADVSDFISHKRPARRDNVLY